MTVVPVGGGEFDVYSGTRGVYRVNIATGECDCADQEHNVGAGECKHALRVELEAGLRDVPLGLRSEHSAPSDVELSIASWSQENQPVALADGGRAKCVECGAWLPDEIESGTGAYCPKCGHGQHITDGGMVAPEPQESESETCDYPGCEHGLGKECPELCYPHWEQRQEARR